MSALPQTAALLLIDLQQAAVDPKWGRRNNPGAERAIGRLLAAWRASGRPVIHIQHLPSESDSPYHPGRLGCEPMPEVAPAAGEVVVQKSSESAFFETGLAALLRDQRIGSLVLVGAGTNNGVCATARMAGDLGLTVIVVSDASWSVGKADLAGRQWPADTRHAVMLANLARTAVIARADQILAWLAPAGRPLAPASAELVARPPSP